MYMYIHMPRPINGSVYVHTVYTGNFAFFLFSFFYLFFFYFSFIFISCESSSQKHNTDVDDDNDDADDVYTLHTEDKVHCKDYIPFSQKTMKKKEIERGKKDKFFWS